MNNNTTTFVTAVLTMFAVVVMIYLLFAPEPAGPFDFPERFLGHTDYDARHDYHPQFEIIRVPKRRHRRSRRQKSPSPVGQ
jgi:hypothetical protein